MIPSRAFRLVVLSLVLFCTAGCDQVTKHLARTELGQIGSATLPGHLIEFTLAENPGGFLSLGASLPQAVRTALIACMSFGMAFLFAYLVRTSRIKWAFFLGLSLIWAGGMSNLIDRFIHHGLVTDFMVVQVGPLHTGIFNLADSVIMIGMLLMLVESLRAGALSSKVH